VTARLRRPVADERGIALVLSLFLTLAMSVVGGSLLFLSQTEALASMNYRLMAQARYGAESGIQHAVNYLLYSYTPPASTGADPLSNYVTTVSPVTYNGSPVILSANDDVAANYPAPAVQSAFAAAVRQLVTAGTTQIEYAPYAALISMELIPAAQSIDGVEHTIQTWRITSAGTIAAGARTAQVEVTAVLDTQKISTTGPSMGYATFATAAGCGALRFTGGASTKSYDSSTYDPSAGSTITAANGELRDADGNVGTNGNLTESGGATINGTLSTPRVGVGNCSSGNVTAQTASGGATVTGGLVTLPSAVTLATPDIPDPDPPTSNLNVVGSSTCATLGLAPPATCSGTNAGTGTGLTINPNGAAINWGDLSLSGGAKLVIAGGSYNLNSLRLSGGSRVTVSSGDVLMTVVETVSFSGGTNLEIPSTGASLNLDLVDTPGIATPVSFSGGVVTNDSYDASKFRIRYGGTGGLSISGGAKNAMVIYAPNAPISLSGGSRLYGAVIGSTINDSGGVTIYYDRNLANAGIFATTKYQPGNPMLSAFSWKKY
jgi:hypothetical protein